MTTKRLENLQGMTINDSVLVKQSVTLSNLRGQVTHIAVTLNDFSHQSSLDTNFMLVAPDGETGFVFWSDVGNEVFSVSNVDITVSDRADGRPGFKSVFSSGTYLPSDLNVYGPSFGGIVPNITYAPGRGAGSFESVFGGFAPNGACGAPWA
jgi:hypothetical protein